MASQDDGTIKKGRSSDHQWEMDPVPLSARYSHYSHSCLFALMKSRWRGNLVDEAL